MSGKKKTTRLVSGVKPLVSRKPRITIPRFWGLMPSWKWGERMTRRREMAPAEKGLLGTILELPLLPLKIIGGIGKEVKGEAEGELDPESRIQRELLDNKMHYETGEIGEKEHKEKESELKKEIR